MNRSSGAFSASPIPSISEAREPVSFRTEPENTLSHISRRPLGAKVSVGLVCVTGLWLLGAWLLSSPELSASDALLTTFASPLLSLEKVAEGNVVGAPITYTITVSNTESNDARGFRH